MSAPRRRDRPPPRGRLEAREPVRPAGLVAARPRERADAGGHARVGQARQEELEAQELSRAAHPPPR